MAQQPSYGTWIRVNKLVMFSALFLVCLILAFIFHNPYLRAGCLILSLPFLYISSILTYITYQFSSRGGNLQFNIHDVIRKNISIEAGNRVLDIGTGSGALLIHLAQTTPTAQFVGIDSWGRDWQYSQEQCEQNADIECVAEYTKFVRASASSLPFEDNSFDRVVSCLTFHEVKDEPEKDRLLGEALRILKKGGKFVFIDLFADTSVFGTQEQLLGTLKNQGILQPVFMDLGQEIPIPKLLLSSKILGNAMILTGQK